MTDTLIEKIRAYEECPHLWDRCTEMWVPMAEVERLIHQHEGAVVKEHAPSEIPVITDDMVETGCRAYMKAMHESFSPDHSIFERGEPNWKLYIDGVRAILETLPKRELINWEAIELIEILHGAILGLQSMSNETAKVRFDEYINLSGDFLLRNSIEVQEGE